jgi:hypothetical protein
VTAARSFVVLVLFSATVMAQPEIAVLEQERLVFAGVGTHSSGSHHLRLTLVTLEGSGWRKERALAALREATRILGQCGVVLEHVDWLQLSVPPRYLDFSTARSRELARLHPVARPAVYMVRDTHSRPAFDAEAIGRGNSRSRPELADTVWLTHATRDDGIVLAHELAHVLMDSGEHSEESGNLMGEQSTPGATTLSAVQCARLRETGSGNGLLERRP